MSAMRLCLGVSLILLSSLLFAAAQDVDEMILPGSHHLSLHSLPVSLDYDIPEIHLVSQNKNQMEIERTAEQIAEQATAAAANNVDSTIIQLIETKANSKIQPKVEKKPTQQVNNQKVAPTPAKVNVAPAATATPAPAPVSMIEQKSNSKATTATVAQAKTQSKSESKVQSKAASTSTSTAKSTVATSTKSTKASISSKASASASASASAESSAVSAAVHELEHGMESNAEAVIEAAVEAEAEHSHQSEAELEASVAAIAQAQALTEAGLYTVSELKGEAFSDKDHDLERDHLSSPLDQLQGHRGVVISGETLKLRSKLSGMPTEDIQKFLEAVEKQALIQTDEVDIVNTLTPHSNPNDNEIREFMSSHPTPLHSKNFNNKNKQLNNGKHTSRKNDNNANNARRMHPKIQQIRSAYDAPLPGSVSASASSSAAVPATSLLETTSTSRMSMSEPQSFDRSAVQLGPSHDAYGHLPMTSNEFLQATNTPPHITLAQLSQQYQPTQQWTPPPPQQQMQPLWTVGHGGMVPNLQGFVPYNSENSQAQASSPLSFLQTASTATPTPIVNQANTNNQQKQNEQYQFFHSF